MMNSKLNSRWVDWLLGLGLFGLALWLRTADLAHFVTADEHNWVYRSGLFFNALLRHDWPGTETWLTPGVTTTWLGTASLSWFYQQHSAEINQPLIDWLVSFSRNKIDLDVLLALRWSIALFSAVMVAVIYGLARKLWSRPVALAGTLLLLTEPYVLAVSRVIGHDALVVFLMTASLLAFLVFTYHFFPTETSTGALKRLLSLRWLIFSGVMAGLAVLSKSTALFLIPFVGLVAIVDIWQDRQRLKGWLGLGLLWGAVMWTTFLFVWPAAWVNPLGQTWSVIQNALLSSAGLEDPDIQSHWAIPDLGIWYYLVNGAFRVSPFLMVGVIIAAIMTVRRRLTGAQSPPDRDSAAGQSIRWLAIFALIYTLLMTVGVKESARYLLPIFPMLAYIAAWGWLKLFKVRWQPLFVAGLGITAVLFTIQYAPYYFTYLNPLVGGPGTAAHLISIGWGQGLDEVARWLNDQPDPIPPHLGARYTATINPFYRGEVSSPVSEELDYVAFYIKQTQNGYPSPEILGYFEQQTPLHRVIINGLEYAQIYQGPAMVPIEVESDSDIKLPVAYRPYKIYAPIGESLEVDLLWPADDELDAQAERSVTLILTAADQSWTASATAPIIKQGPNVIVSRHQFDLPPDLDRDSVELRLEQKTLGQLKTRLMSVPDDFQPLSTVFNNQINLAGIKQTRTPEGLDIELAWQGWSNVSNDYTIFIQLLDSQGERITGVDIAPDPGFTQLDRKEVKLTQHSVPLPTDMSPGEYTMLIGLYYFAGDQLITIGSVNLDEPIVLP